MKDISNSFSGVGNKELRAANKAIELVGTSIAIAAQELINAIAKFKVSIESISEFSDFDLGELPDDDTSDT